MNKKRRAREHRKIAEHEVLIVDKSPDLLEVISRSPTPPLKNVQSVPKTDSSGRHKSRVTDSMSMSQPQIPQSYHRMPKTPPELPPSHFHAQQQAVRPNGRESDLRHRGSHSMSTLPQLPLPDIRPEDEVDMDPSPYK